MSRKIGKLVIIEPEPDLICSYCGKVTETRPYGPGGTEICATCAKKTPEMKAIMYHNMGIKLFGDPGELK